MTDKDINNPLQNITVGSTVNNLQDGFSGSVVVKPITIMVQQQQSRAVITGKSGYFYSNTMNRGSLSISGSYGFSAISQITSSVSGYVGQAKADDVRTTRVDYHAIIQAGVEYINFNSLNPADLLTSLAITCQDPAMQALEKYKALLRPNLTESEKLIALQDWQESRAKFFAAAGHGVVVGILWGAIGSVSMTMSQGSGSTAWQYGGDANFSYSGLAASLSVQATYDGSNASGRGDVSVEVTKYSDGGVIATEVDNWYQQFSSKSFDQLANLSVIASPTFPSANLSPPSNIPAFLQPTADPQIKAKVEELKSLQELKQLEKDAQFQEEQKKNPSLTRDEFEKMAEENADVAPLNDLITNVKNNSIGLTH